MQRAAGRHEEDAGGYPCPEHADCIVPDQQAAGADRPGRHEVAAIVGEKAARAEALPKAVDRDCGP